MVDENLKESTCNIDNNSLYSISQWRAHYRDWTRCFTFCGRHPRWWRPSTDFQIYVPRHLFRRDGGCTLSSEQSVFLTIRMLSATLTLTISDRYTRSKPVHTSVSTVFLLLLIYTAGNVWARFFPARSWVVGTRLEWLAPVFDFINPGSKFSIKEVNSPSQYWQNSN